MPESAVQFVADAIAAHLESGAFPDEGDAARLLYAAEIKIMRELAAQRPALVERVLHRRVRDRRTAGLRSGAYPACVLPAGDCRSLALSFR
jgi:hypothetical protein